MVWEDLQKEFDNTQTDLKPTKTMLAGHSKQRNGEECELPDNDDIGMQALQREHEDLERDLVVLEHKVNQWVKKAIKMRHISKDNTNTINKEPRY